MPLEASEGRFRLRTEIRLSAYYYLFPLSRYPKAFLVLTTFVHPRPSNKKEDAKKRSDNLQGEEFKNLG